MEFVFLLICGLGIWGFEDLGILGEEPGSGGPRNQGAASFKEPGPVTPRLNSPAALVYSKDPYSP